MVIDGNFDALNINSSFDMTDENGEKVFDVSRNLYMKDKVFISSPNKGIEYLGEIVHQNLGSEEFIVYEEESEILRIKHSSPLGIPKFEITSPFGDFTAKFSLRKRSMSIFNGSNEVLTFIGNQKDYNMTIDDDCNIFYVMTIAYGITALMNIEI